MIETFELAFSILLVIGLIFFAFLASSFKIIYEHKKMILFKLGRVIGVYGPAGPVFIVPFSSRRQVVDKRIKFFSLSALDVITQDYKTTIHLK
jgi:regulator of protease activity HflC (stomatin/prohibitin superfamily)